MGTLACWQAGKRFHCALIWHITNSSALTLAWPLKVLLLQSNHTGGISINKPGYQDVYCLYAGGQAGTSDDAWRFAYTCEISM